MERMTLLRAALLLNCIKLLNPRAPALLSLPSRSFAAMTTPIANNPLVNPSFLPRYAEIKVPPLPLLIPAPVAHPPTFRQSTSFQE